MSVQYNAKPPREYLCQISRKIMNTPICARWSSGRFVICDSAVLKKWNEANITEQLYHDANSLQTEPRPDLEQAICLWKKEHVMEPIDSAQLGVLIAGNSLDAIPPDPLNAYLRYVFAMAKTNDVAKSVVVVGKHQQKAPPSFDQLSRPEGLDNLSQCVLQLILSEAKREFERSQCNSYPDSRELRNTGYQQSVPDRQLHRGMGVLTYTPAVGSRSETPASEVIAPRKPLVEQRESSQSYSVWPVSGELPRFQREHSRTSETDRPSSEKSSIGSRSETRTDAVVAAWKPSVKEEPFGWTVG